MAVRSSRSRPAATELSRSRTAHQMAETAAVASDAAADRVDAGPDCMVNQGDMTHDATVRRETQYPGNARMGET